MCCDAKGHTRGTKICYPEGTNRSYTKGNGKNVSEVTHTLNFAAVHSKITREPYRNGFAVNVNPLKASYIVIGCQHMQMRYMN